MIQYGGVEGGWGTDGLKKSQRRGNTGQYLIKMPNVRGLQLPKAFTLTTEIYPLKVFSL